MAALTKDRNTPKRDGEFVVVTPKDGVTIYAGSIVAIDSNGELVPASDTAGIRVIGRAENYSEGQPVTCRKGVFGYENDGSITSADIGSKCYIVDDQTVGKTTTNSIEAGVIFDVDDEGVWVKIN
ncbi:MAG: hypothetical protein PWR10_1547 [Halanaerobiales bacterium]|nr:hypothetical protein [Halanaerobiales bacterium]